MFETGKSFEYPSSNWVLYNIVGIPVTVAMVGASIYALFVEAQRFFPDILTMIAAICIGTLGLLALLFNYYQTGTIIVNDREIISLKPRRRVAIPWSDIDRIYYTMGRGGLPGDPHFTVYLFSKTKEFILVQREINGITELMDTIRLRTKPKHTEYIPFRRVVVMFLRRYIHGLHSA